MAKQFGGFTPEQLGKIDPAMAGMQADEQVKYMAANPGVSSRVGNMAQQAKKRIAMAHGGLVPHPVEVPAAAPAATPNVAPVPATDSYRFPITDGPALPPIIDDPIISPGEPITSPGEPTPAPTGYDPSQGLPTAPDKMYADTASAIDSIFEKPTWNEGNTGVNANINDDKTWAKTSVEANAANATIMANPTDYKLVKVGSYFQVQYPDGTSIKTDHGDITKARGRANALAASFKAAGAVGTQEEIDAAKAKYDEELNAYKSYYGEKAGEAAAAPSKSLQEQVQAKATAQNLLRTYSNQLANLSSDDPQRAAIQSLIDEQAVVVSQANAAVVQAQSSATEAERVARTARMEERANDPAGQVSKAEKITIDPEAASRGELREGVGQSGEAGTATGSEVIKEGDVDAPTVSDAVTYTAEKTATDVKNTLDKLEAATGKPSNEALAQAQTMNPDELASLGLNVEQIQQAVTVQAPAARKMEAGEAITGPTVDMARVETEALNFEAATGVPSSDATVKGQLTSLMSDFEGGNPPAWAAGALRGATAAMAARGLSASSMAGQALVQAAMESALPIAMQDAQTVAGFEAQNLSNRQQVAMFGAEQRAKFLGMEFDQAFQTRVANAAKVSDIANMNFTADTQIALENARIASTVQLTNLNSKNAKIMADAAAMTNIELSNLSNRQQAAVQQAGAFLQMDMTNLSNKQQVSIFKSQGNIQSILSDAAATNAAEQFNSSSENQTNQFYESMITQVAQFNIEQGNSMERFTVEQQNAIKTFNVSQRNSRSEFNATQALVIEQANAKWTQSIVTVENAAAIEAASAAALAQNNMTLQAAQADAQAQRDSVSHAFQTENNNADRITTLAVQAMADEADKTAAGVAKAGAAAMAIGKVLGYVATA